MIDALAGIALVLVVVVPGAVAELARRAVLGEVPDGRYEFNERVVHFAIWSAFLLPSTAVATSLLVDYAHQDTKKGEVLRFAPGGPDLQWSGAGFAVLGLMLYLVVPAAVGALVALVQERVRGGIQYVTAWDSLFYRDLLAAPDGAIIRFRLRSDGTWRAGFWGGASYALLSSTSGGGEASLELGVDVDASTGELLLDDDDNPVVSDRRVHVVRPEIDTIEALFTP